MTLPQSDLTKFLSPRRNPSHVPSPPHRCHIWRSSWWPCHRLYRWYRSFGTNTFTNKYNTNNIHKKHIFTTYVHKLLQHTTQFHNTYNTRSQYIRHTTHFKKYAHNTKQAFITHTAHDELSEFNRDTPTTEAIRRSQSPYNNLNFTFLLVAIRGFELGIIEWTSQLQKSHNINKLRYSDSPTTNNTLSRLHTYTYTTHDPKHRQHTYTNTYIISSQHIKTRSCGTHPSYLQLNPVTYHNVIILYLSSLSPLPATFLSLFLSCFPLSYHIRISLIFTLIT